MKKIQSKCPGQDTRNWKAGDIYELECSSCGNSVEFFKTDRFLICPKCKKPIINDKLDLGCAEWCSNSSMCTGLQTLAGKKVN